MGDYAAAIEDWRKAADENLRKENSWLALAGLFWLSEGENTFGSDLSNSIVLPSGSAAASMGVFILHERQVTMLAADDVDLLVDGEILKEAVLQPDTSGSPTEIRYQDLTMILIDREDGFAIRLWDNQRPERLGFPGRVWFPIDPEYLVDVVYQPFEHELDLVLQRKNGSDLQDQAQGEVKFQLGGQELSLVVFEQEDGSLFTLFLDQTSGVESYPAGRYLVIPPPKEGILKIDFNRAYNPPCAFTDYATCPLPPAQNRLSAAILVGEKYHSG